VGGGVIGDLVGFAAATYLRGVRLVHVPTTLLAQVDSAIGGKVGINHPLGKNLIGSFHPPRLVIADPVVLATLPRREFRAGLYEVVKYGIISSPTLFDLVASSLAALFKREETVLAQVVAESCRIKAEVVSADERESGLRRILNFGHTVAHALEAVTKYRRFRHGEAVAYGMVAAMHLGANRGVTPTDARDRLIELIAKLGPLPPVSDLSAKEIVGAIAHDKKVVEGTLHFIAATGIGTTTTIKDVTEKELKAAVKAIGITKN
jgi:3-dehydroquinate synthase